MLKQIDFYIHENLLFKILKSLGKEKSEFALDFKKLKFISRLQRKINPEK